MNQIQEPTQTAATLANVIPAGAYLPAPTQGQLGEIINLVVKGLTSPHTKRVYRMALTKFLAFFQESGFTAFTKATANSYKDHMLARIIYDKEGKERHLEPAPINIQLSAIRALAIEAAGTPILPHDCRRSFPRNAKKKGGDTRQIGIILDHDYLDVTENYIRSEQEFHLAPCDLLDLG